MCFLFVFCCCFCSFFLGGGGGGHDLANREEEGGEGEGGIGRRGGGLACCLHCSDCLGLLQAVGFFGVFFVLLSCYSFGCCWICKTLDCAFSCCSLQQQSYQFFHFECASLTLL